MSVVYFDNPNTATNNNNNNSRISIPPSVVTSEADHSVNFLTYWYDLLHLEVVEWYGIVGFNVPIDTL